MRYFKTQAPIVTAPHNNRQNALMNYHPQIENKAIAQQRRPLSSAASSPKLFFNYKSNN
jgi:hypothetical protein